MKSIISCTMHCYLTLHICNKVKLEGDVKFKFKGFTDLHESYRREVHSMQTPLATHMR